MNLKEDVIREIEITSLSMGIPEEQTRELSARISMILKDYIISEGSTDLAIREQNEDVLTVKKFIASKRINGCTPRTIECYSKVLLSVLPRIQKPIKDITVDDIRWYLADREFNDGVSRTTCGNELRVLSSLFQFLNDEGVISGNPIRKLGKYKKEKQKKEAFTEDEIEAMREAIETPKEHALFEMLLSTGCRVSELAQIKYSEINGNKILVHGKGSKDRMVYLNVKAVRAMNDYIADKDIDSQESPYLFPKGECKYRCKHPEEHMDKSSIGAIIRDIGERVDVKAHPHKFRRTCATFALKRGMDLIYVSKMLGHDSVDTTQIYLDLNEEEMETHHKKYVI